MSAAAVEHPCDGEPPTLLEEASRLMEHNPGYRVEIIGGILTVTPPPDGAHARTLTQLMLPFVSAGLHGEETVILQAVGLWLPDGPEDHTIPEVYAPGQQIALPASIGAEVKLDATELLKAGAPRRSDDVSG
ncbi:hypothetical protein GLX30_19980 [Streptomyces sp. Tu 2975]|uniref:hypothetical protein n=1 Tax=Streptomyces sp. Tu 2975 TaxID=2676871 RepID=UPI0013581D2B|nr:hypothetical protein [Streptomyces sp. Tu 2975]QIP85931.1 hypothetical protein GLX30_19980 [Streptomyces sp. Tu 2975]